MTTSTQVTERIARYIPHYNEKKEVGLAGEENRACSKIIDLVKGSDGTQSLITKFPPQNLSNCVPFDVAPQ